MTPFARIIASSASVYGTADSFPTRETHHPYNNHTLYGVAKVTNEGMARAFHDMYGLDYVATRCFNVYGPRQSPGNPYTGVISLFCRNLLAGERQPERNFLRQTRVNIDGHDPA
jgi:UDP-glucose 4-epimerase